MKTTIFSDSNSLLPAKIIFRRRVQLYIDIYVYITIYHIIYIYEFTLIELYSCSSFIPKVTVWNYTVKPVSTDVPYLEAPFGHRQDISSKTGYDRATKYTWNLQDASRCFISDTRFEKNKKNTYIWGCLKVVYSVHLILIPISTCQYNIVQPSIYSNPCPRLFRRTAPFSAPLLPWATIQNWGQPKNDSRNKMHSELCILIYRYS